MVAIASKIVLCLVISTITAAIKTDDILVIKNGDGAARIKRQSSAYPTIQEEGGYISKHTNKYQQSGIRDRNVYSVNPSGGNENSNRGNAYQVNPSQHSKPNAYAVNPTSQFENKQNVYQINPPESSHEHKQQNVYAVNPSESSYGHKQQNAYQINPSENSYGHKQQNVYAVNPSESLYGQKPSQNVYQVNPQLQENTYQQNAYAPNSGNAYPIVAERPYGNKNTGNVYQPSSNPEEFHRPAHSNSGSGSQPHIPNLLSTGNNNGENSPVVDRIPSIVIESKYVFS